MKLFKTFIITALSLLFVACEKEEKPYQLPPPGPAQFDQINMGSDYTSVVYYLLSGAKQESRLLSDWDLALEAHDSGIVAFVNGGIGHQVWRTGTTDILASTDMAAARWSWDPPSLNRDSTAIGFWANQNFVTTGEVMVLDRGERITQNRYKKFMLLELNKESYTIRSMNLDGSMDRTFLVFKNQQKSYVYANLENGEVENYEPNKDQWDFKFIRYRFIYYDMTPIIPYEVNGVILNPNGVKVAETSVHDFEEIDFDLAKTLAFTTRRDAIGFDWKRFDFDRNAFITDSKRIFIIRATDGVYYKLRFLDFYDKQGVKGAPSFDFQAL